MTEAECLSDVMAGILDDDPFAYALYWHICLFSDNCGRMPGHPANVMVGCFKRMDIKVSKIEKGLDLLEERGCIQRYSSHDGDKQYLQVTDYTKKQEVHWMKTGQSEYPPPPGWVQPETQLQIYLMRCNGLLKIGASVDTNKRREQLRQQSRGTMDDICILAVLSGTPATERQLHRRFKEHKVRGEWFVPHPDILAYFGVNQIA